MVINGINRLINDAQLHAQDFESFRQYCKKHEITEATAVTETIFKSFAEQTWFWTIINSFLKRFTGLEAVDVELVTNFITQDTYERNYNTKKTFIAEF
jgi:hypothetical protein